MEGQKNDRIETVPTYSVEQKRKEYSERLRIALTPHEWKIISLQSLLVGEIPLYSALFCVSINGLFWLATYLRIFYLIGITGFCLFFTDLLVHHIWPEIRVPLTGQDSEEWTPVHPDMLGVPELSRHLGSGIVRVEQFIESCAHLRTTKPTKFFVCATTLCIMVGVVGHYVKGIYIVYSFFMGCLMLPSMYHYNVRMRLQGIWNPMVKQIEDTMNIKRKRSKKGKMSADTGAEYADSDEEIESFVPEGLSQVSLKIKASDTDDDYSGHTHSLLTSHMPEVGPSRDISDDDSTYGDMPSQMPSILSMEDSLSNLSLGDFPDYMPNLSNNNPQVQFAGQIKPMEPEEDTEDADVTLHEDDDTSQSIASSSSAADAPIEQSDHVDTEGDNLESAKNVDFKFVSHHFKESSDEDDESRLVHGLEFPDIDDEIQPDAEVSSSALGFLSNITQGSGQQMGTILAGALSGAQDTVSNMVATQMMTSIMQQTVAGISKLSGTAEAAEAPVDPGRNKVKAKIKVEGQGSRDSDAEFEFLNQDDFEFITTDE